MRYPPLEHWPRYPVTVGIAIGAIVMTGVMNGWWWHGANIAFLKMGDQSLSNQIWQPLTSCLLHADFLHLFFNLFWLWVFGALFEEIFGSGRFFSVVIFLAFGSSVAEYAFSIGGVGLSGVNYGLFGLLWVLHRKDRRFWGTLDRRTVQFMVGWFFFCIVATMAHAMRVANVAHGAGAILGVMLGYALVEKNKRRKQGYIALIVVAMLAIFAAGTGGRKYINFSGYAEREAEKQAYSFSDSGDKAFDDHHYQEAAEFYSKAITIDDSHSAWWYNLGLSYYNSGQQEKALDAFQHALKLKPDDEQSKAMIEFCSFQQKIKQNKQKPEE